MWRYHSYISHTLKFIQPPIAWSIIVHIFHQSPRVYDYFINRINDLRAANCQNCRQSRRVNKMLGGILSVLTRWVQIHFALYPFQTDKISTRWGLALIRSIHCAKMWNLYYKQLCSLEYFGCNLFSFQLFFLLSFQIYLLLFLLTSLFIMYHTFINRCQGLKCIFPELH